MSVKYEKLTLKDLREKAKSKGCVGYSKMKKEELVSQLKDGCTKKSKSPKSRYEKLSVSELRVKVQKQGCPGYSKMNREELIKRLNKGCFV